PLMTSRRSTSTLTVAGSRSKWARWRAGAARFPATSRSRIYFDQAAGRWQCLFLGWLPQSLAGRGCVETDPPSPGVRVDWPARLTLLRVGDAEWIGVVCPWIYALMNSIS